MKDQIVKVMEDNDFTLSIEEDGGLIFEGPMIAQTKLDAIIEQLFAISKDLDIMLFQVDENTLMLAIFYEMPMV